MKTLERHSMKSWLVNRDPQKMAYEITPIKLGSIIPYIKQPTGVFNTAQVGLYWVDYPLCQVNVPLLRWDKHGIIHLLTID